MLTLKSFAEGKPLYSETYTQYGPAFYLLTEPLHSVLGLPFTQHAIRLKTAILWVLPVLFTMNIVHRLGGNRILAVFTSCMVAIHLSRLALEPGHPQEISLLMSMATLWLVVDRSPRRWWLAGTCAALCGMCKLNVGFAMTMPLLLAAANALPDIKHLRTVVVIAIGAIVSLAIGATAIPLNLDRGGAACTIVLFLSWLAVCFFAIRFGRAKRQPAALTETVISGLLVSCAIVSWTWLNGTPLKMLGWGMLGQHAGFAKTFFQPIPVSLFGVVSAILVVTSYRSRKSMCIACFVSLAIAVFQTASNAIPPLTFQIQNAAEWLAMVGPCFAPALLLYRKRLLHGRVMLAAMTAIGPWIAFPIPGTQLMLGTLPAWLTIGIVASDCHQSLVLNYRPNEDGSTESEKWISVSRLLLSSSLMVGFVAAVIPSARWVTGKSLGMNGSDWIHLEPKDADLEQQLTREIIQTGATYLAFDGHTNSRFYFWTGLKPLTSSNATIWPYLLSERELKGLNESIEKATSLCVVVPPGIPRPLDNAHTTESKTRRSLYQNTEFHFNHPSGWSIGQSRQNSK